MVHVQLVMGPAGVGKSVSPRACVWVSVAPVTSDWCGGPQTYCQAMQEHAASERRVLNVANLDPAAENFGYDMAFDIRDLITLEDVMDELGYGPNGGLLY